MTLHEFLHASGYINILTGIVGIIRFRSILPKDRPLVYVLCIGGINILVCDYLMKRYHNDFPGNNTYELFDILIFSTLFYNWGCLYPRRWLLRTMQAGFILIWLLDIRSIAGLSNQNTLFGVVFSFAEAFMAIDRINAFIITDRGNLLLNGRFLAAIAVVFFCAYYVIVAVFLWINPPMSERFLMTLITMWESSNLLSSLIMLVAMFLLPRRERFVIPAGPNPARTRMSLKSVAT